MNLGLKQHVINDLTSIERVFTGHPCATVRNHLGQYLAVDESSGKAPRRLLRRRFRRRGWHGLRAGFACACTHGFDVCVAASVPRKNGEFSFWITIQQLEKFRLPFDFDRNPTVGLRHQGLFGFPTGPLCKNSHGQSFAPRLQAPVGAAAARRLATLKQRLQPYSAGAGSEEPPIQ